MNELDFVMEMLEQDMVVLEMRSQVYQNAAGHRALQALQHKKFADEYNTKYKNDPYGNSHLLSMADSDERLYAKHADKADKLSKYATAKKIKEK